MAERDVLGADLEVNDRDALAKLSNFYKQLRETAAGIDKLGDGSKFAEQFKSKLADAGRVAEKTRQQFASIVRFDTSNNSLDGLSQSAIKLTQETAKANIRVRETQRILSEYKGTNQSLFRVLISDAEEAERSLARLERRADQLTQRRATRPGGGANGLGLSSFQKTNLGYQANDVITQAALGASPFQIIASQGGQIAQTFNADQITAFAKAYGGLIPILGLGSAALLLTYKITGDIRDRAEQRLKTEEKIASILNKQRLAAKEATDEFNKGIDTKAEARRIQNFQEDNPIDTIRGRRQIITDALNRQANDKTEESAAGIAKLRNEYNLLDDQIQDFERNRAKAAKALPDAQFAQRFEEFKKNQEIERRRNVESLKLQLTETPNNARVLRTVLKRVEALPDSQSGERFELTKSFNEAIRASVEAGKQQINALQRQTESLFESLNRQAGSQNPFVAVFADAKKLIEETTVAVAALRPELRKTALDMAAQINATNLFSARLETGLSALSLRDDAGRFRNASNRPRILSQDDRDGFVTRALQRRDTVANGTTFNAGRQIGDLSAEEKSRVFQAEFLRGANDGNRASFVSALATQLIGEKPQDANLTVQERLQKQLDFINSSGAKTDAEKQIADRKIIALTSSLDPEKLTDPQRNAAATARENEARRLETAEKAADKNRADQLTTMQNLDKNIGELLKIAQSDGLTGVIRIINEADDRTRVELGKRPNDRSTEKQTK